MINTKSTTVVENIIGELCSVIGVGDDNEKEEFSLYCIVEGERERGLDTGGGGGGGRQDLPQLATLSTGAPVMSITRFI